MKKNKLIIFVMLIIFAFTLVLVACSNQNNATSINSSTTHISKQSGTTSKNSDSSTNSITQNSILQSSQNNNSQNNSNSNSNQNSSSKPTVGQASSSVISNTTAYVEPTNASQLNTNHPVIVKTVFTTEDTVVADAIVTNFGADSTGKNDSTNAIKSAISSVSSNGGGTVYFPYGKYLVTSTITVPSYVSLRGDWQNPDSNNPVYGTVILAKPSVITSTSKPQDSPLFSLDGNSGISSMTVVYPEQSISNIKRYGFTVYANSAVTATIKNFTVINGCYGIGASINTSMGELFNLENIYGTFLYNAVSHGGLSDVGNYDNVNISPKYWLNSGTFACTNETALKNYLKTNCEALILGDLDDQLISNVNIDYCKIGFKFTSGVRANSGFWGLVYNANITNSSNGVYADILNSQSGVVFTSSSLETINNNSDVGIIKLCDTITTSISGTGDTITESGNSNLSSYKKTFEENYIKSNKLLVVDNSKSGGENDFSNDLQSAINSLGAEGGIVYVQNGIYRLNSTITVKSNVELRSSQNLFSRTNQSQNGKNGVVFISYIDSATIALNSNAGIRGIRIWHAKNDFIKAKNELTNNSSICSQNISVSGTTNSYATLVESVGAYIGFSFKNADNHILKSNYGLAYSKFIIAGGSNGIINGCLANPNFCTRSNLYTYFDSTTSTIDNWIKLRNSGESNSDFITLRDNIGRTYTKMVELIAGSNEYVLNTFCYGESGLFVFSGMNNALLVNTSLDFLFTTSYVYEMISGSATIIGSLRVYGTSIGYTSGTLKAYGRIAFGVNKEKAYDSTINIEDIIDYVGANATHKTLFECESIPTSVSGVTVNTNASYVKNGTSSWKLINSGSNLTFSSKFNSIDISNYQDGYVHITIYCDDITKLGNESQLEITSSGTCDSQELSWSFNRFIIKNGWNEIYLPLSSSSVTGGSIILSQVNYMRIYSLSTSANLYIDGIEFVTD